MIGAIEQRLGAAALDVAGGCDGIEQALVGRQRPCRAGPPEVRRRKYPLELGGPAIDGIQMGLQVDDRGRAMPR